MQLILMTEPQLGGTYEDLLFAARAAESAGLDGFARSDHYYWSREPGLPTTDAFATLGGLARETSRIRLCVLVSPITFRHPAVIAKMAASIDEMSGGRFDLGLGTGWMEEEHTAFGLPFPRWKERFERLEDSLQYLRASFGGGSFEGRYYRTDADAQPRPTALRIVVGGSGPEKTPTLAGRFADEYNHFIAAPDQLQPKIERMRESAAAHGRDPASITISLMCPAVLADDERRLGELLAEAAAFRRIGVPELAERWEKARVPMGSSERATESLAAFEAMGITKYYLQWFQLTDREGIAEQADLAGRLTG
jgi:alkanesulfonate monooxygenase SsuD/methylene tetrahydromethanopterin reductase-like flavin-dependent oxidoreductase (luciferase family)